MDYELSIRQQAQNCVGRETGVVAGSWSLFRPDSKGDRGCISCLFFTVQE